MLAFFASGRTGLRNRGSDSWALTVIQNLATIDAARALLGRIAAAVPASGPSTRVEAVLQGVAATVEYVARSKNAHAAVHTDAVHTMLAVVIDQWAALATEQTGPSRSACTSPSAGDALNCLLKAAEDAGREAMALRSPMAAPCLKLAALFTTKVHATVKHCFGELTVDTTATVVSTSPYTPVGPGLGERMSDLDVLSALRDAAVDAAHPDALAAVCCGCIGLGTKAPPMPESPSPTPAMIVSAKGTPLPPSPVSVPWTGGMEAGFACIGGIEIDVEPAPVLVVAVDYNDETGAVRPRPFVPPLHWNPLSPKAGDEYVLSGAVVTSSPEAGAGAHTAHDAAVVADTTDTAAAGAPGDLAAGGSSACGLSAGATACGEPACFAHTVGSLLCIDDERVVEGAPAGCSGEEPGVGAAASWFGSAAADRGPGMAPTLLFYSRRE